MNVNRAVAELEARHGLGTLVTVVDKQGHGPAMPGAKMLVYPDGTSEGTVGGGALEKAATHEARKRIKNRENGTVTYNLDDDNHVIDATETGMICGGTTTLFFEVLGPDVRLTIFGAGHIGQAMDRFANQLGFALTVADTRPDMLENIGYGHPVHLSDYGSAEKSCPNEEGSYVVIATHSHALDAIALKGVLSQGIQPRYIGVVASIKKARQMVAEIRKTDPQINLGHLHMPVGLNIGGPSPAEIALSILAEIQAVRYERDGQHNMGPTW